MIFVKDLFATQNILCPEWLSSIPLDDEWIDSSYSFEEGVHKWRYKDALKDVEISYDGMTYRDGVYRNEDFYLLSEITEDDIIHV